MKRAHSNQDSSSQNESGLVETVFKGVKSSKCAGIVHKISLENFLCHDKLEMQFNEQINFIIGKNGSGKSAVLTGIVVALGERASATCRGNSTKDFVKTGKSKAVVKVTLSNKGQGSYKRDTYGNYITIERSISAATGGGGYKILNEQGRIISTKRSDLNRILAKMNLQVDNPVCILNQETAKNFLHSNDAHQKYKLFERATQMDVMHDDFSLAEDELSRSKSCMKEKNQSLELLKAEVQKWLRKKEWYEAINEIHDKKARLENEIAWAQVEDYEKKALAALTMKENQMAEIERIQKRLEEQEDRLTTLKDAIKNRNDGVAEKAKEIRNAQAKAAEIETQVQEFNGRMREVAGEIRQIEIEKRRLQNDKQDLVKEIEKLKKAHGDSEFALRKERRIKELATLKAKHESLDSLRKVSEHQIEQLKGALTQLKNETQAARSELSRIQKSLEPKQRTLNDLRKADSNAYAVFGNWVPPLIQRIDRTQFRGAKPKGPIGAYIKLKDKSWAPVVENFFGAKLYNFICSNDDDAKLLNRLFVDVVPNGKRPQIITSCMNGQPHQVSNYKVTCGPELQSQGIHCLMDMLIIDDPDIANILIDLCTIEQVLLIRDEQTARYLLADSNRVPHNCKSAITKEGNTYFPDPNYRSYSGRSPKTAQYLQASVEDAIRNLEEEIEILRREEENSRLKVRNLSSQVQNNECQLRSEETKLTSTRRDFTSVCEKIRTLESEHEPEPTDVLALEEDLLEVEQKLEKNENEHQVKTTNYEELKQEVHTVRQIFARKQKDVTSLTAETQPLKDAIRHNQIKERELKDNIGKFTASLASMQSKLQGFETDYQTAKQKAESEAATVAIMSTRVPVTKSLKNLNSELRQIKEQVAAQESEYGSREHVLNEYRRRQTDYERANSEVRNSQRSLKKMIEMCKQRKAFIGKFRSSIEMRTHHVFQSLMKTRNFEGAIQINSNEKSLVLLVTPPGREESASQPAPKRSRGNGATDICSLSGGERSFATVCFILSLWDAIESPFRILDEFDVFMDHVNRSISMDLLISEAREHFGRQFIFLTPLGLEKQQLRSLDDLSIFRMTDPERNEEETATS